MTKPPMRRRRSPDWLRLMTSQHVHGLAHRLQNDFRLTGLSDGQDRLLDQCISELEWRHAHPLEWASCFCDLCLDPFPWEQLTLDQALDAVDAELED